MSALGRRRQASHASARGENRRRRPESHALVRHADDESRSPSAQTISVALGSRETMRRLMRTASGRGRRLPSILSPQAPQRTQTNSYLSPIRQTGAAGRLRTGCATRQRGQEQRGLDPLELPAASASCHAIQPPECRLTRPARSAGGGEPPLLWGANDDRPTTEQLDGARRTEAARRRCAVFLETYGCQMNVADSELVSGTCAAPATKGNCDPAAADVLLVNTCAIRENAGGARARPSERPAAPQDGASGVRLGLLGCVATHQRDRLLDRAPYLDVTRRTRRVSRPARAAAPGRRARSSSWCPRPRRHLRRPRRTSRRVRAFLTVMHWLRQVLHPSASSRSRARRERSVPPGGPRWCAARGGRRQARGRLPRPDRERGTAPTASTSRNCCAASAPRRSPSASRPPHPSDVSDALIRSRDRAEGDAVPAPAAPVGVEPVLEAMRRDYTGGGVRAASRRVRAAVPGIGGVHRRHRRIPRRAAERLRRRDGGGVPARRATISPTSSHVTRRARARVRTRCPGRCPDGRSARARRPDRDPERIGLEPTARTSGREVEILGPAKRPGARGGQEPSSRRRSSVDRTRGPASSCVRASTSATAAPPDRRRGRRPIRARGGRGQRRYRNRLSRAPSPPGGTTGTGTVRRAPELTMPGFRRLRIGELGRDQNGLRRNLRGELDRRGRVPRVPGARGTSTMRSRPWLRVEAAAPLEVAEVRLDADAEQHHPRRRPRWRRRSSGTPARCRVPLPAEVGRIETQRAARLRVEGRTQVRGGSGSSSRSRDCEMRSAVITPRPRSREH